MYSKKQRIAAIVGIVLLLLLYIVTLVAAIFNFDGKGKMFMVCLFATIVVPIMIWIYVWMYGKLTNKKTFATGFPESENFEKEQPDVLAETNDTIS